MLFLYSLDLNIKIPPEKILYSSEHIAYGATLVDKNGKQLPQGVIVPKGR